MSDAYRYGEISGAALGLALLLLGAAKCVSIARRRSTSAACAYGLCLVLLGWATATIPTVARTLQPDAKPWTSVFLLLALPLVGAGGIVAIVGLVDYPSKPHYRQGQRQAIAALVVAVLLGLGVLGGLAVRVAAWAKEQQGLSGTPAAAAKPEPIVRQDLNFSFQPPGRPWVSWDAKKTNAVVTFGLMRTRPQTFFMMIAEGGGGVAVPDTAALVAIAQASLHSGSDDARISDERIQRIGSMDGTRFHADVKKGKLSLTYVFWVFSRNGYCYQLVTFGSASDRASVRREADDLVARFRQIDPERTETAAEPEPLGALRSDDLGLAADLSGTGWFDQKQMAKENPEAALGGLREGGGGFLVTPLLFETEAPRIEAVTQATLKEWGIAYPSPDVTQVRAITEGELRGHRFRYARAVDGTDYDYRFKVMAGRRYGVFVAVWAHRGEAALDKWTEALFARLRTSPPRVRAEELPGPLRAYQARLHNRLGLFAFAARDYRQAKPQFQAAVRLDDQDTAYLLNALRSFSNLGQWKEGLAYLQPLAHPARQNDDVRSWEAWFLKEDGRRDEALAVYGPLFAGAYREDDEFSAYGILLASAGRFEDLKRAYDRYLKGHESAKLRRDEARLLGQGGRHAEALAVLDRQPPAAAFDAELAWARLQHLRALKRDRERVAVCEDLIRNGFASYDAYYEKGDAETGLRWYQRAKASLEAALKQKPNDEDAKDYLQHVSGLLGEGNNSAIKDAIEAVPVPGALSARLRQLSSAASPAGEGSRYAYWVQGYVFQKGGEARTTTRRRILVSDQAGVERFSTLEVDFDPLFESVYVNELTVRDAKGRVVASGQPSDYYVIDKRGDVATHDKTLFAPVPGLAAGHVLDFTVTRRELGKAQTFAYRALRMGSDLPSGLHAVYYLGETRAIRHRANSALRPETVPGGLLWKLETVPAQPVEPLQPIGVRTQAVLWLGDAGSEWVTLGREYLASIEAKLTPAAATETLARRLTRGRTDRQQILDSVAEHVHRDYVYKPLEFGRRGRIPNAAPATIRAKYGDCKDHAVLMQGLLRAAGVASHLALVSTADDFQAEVPSLDQFNHMVLFVPAAGAMPARFYDGTDKGMNPQLSPPLGLAGRSALVLDPAEPRFERIADYTPHSSAARMTRQVRLVADQGLAVTEKVEITGYFAATLRDHLTTLDARGQRTWGQGVVSAAARGAQLLTLTATNVREAAKPLIVEMAYTLPQQCSTEGSGLRCPLAAPWESYYLEATAVADRRTPFQLSYPFEISSSTTVRGDGCTRLAWENRRASGQAEFASWSVKEDVQGSSATLTLEAALRPGTFAASRYGEYVRQMDLAIRSVSRSLTCSR